MASAETGNVFPSFVQYLCHSSPAAYNNSIGLAGYIQCISSRLPAAGVFIEGTDSLGNRFCVTGRITIFPLCFHQRVQMPALPAVPCFCVLMRQSLKPSNVFLRNGAGCLTDRLQHTEQGIAIGSEKIWIADCPEENLFLGPDLPDDFQLSDGWDCLPSF